jgi:hypothetical protein
VEVRFRRRSIALKASELLVATKLPELAEAAGSASIPPRADDTLVFRSPRGRGYVYVFGALDAWRYRNEATAFDDFASTLMHEAASEAQPPVSVLLTTRLQTVDREIGVLVRLRDASDADATVAATLTRPDGTTRDVRLWPGAEPRTFAGTITSDVPGRHALTVSDGVSSTQTLFAVRTAADVEPDEPAALRAFATAHGGRTYHPGELDQLVADLADLAAPPTERRRVHPMRSAWWLFPFAVCLSVEWWLRRRRGER